MKDGKISVSDREKYREMSVSQGGLLSVPEVLAKAFVENGLVSKWVSKRKISDGGGTHPRGWIPYEITPEQKKELPKLSLGNVVKDFLERGDMILAVKPVEFNAEHKRYLQDKTDRQLDAKFQETDAEGKRIMFSDKQ
jgi:hypothetical protein